MKDLTGFIYEYCPNGLKTTSVSQDCISGEAGNEEDRQNPHSKDRGRGEDSPVT